VFDLSEDDIRNRFKFHENIAKGILAQKNNLQKFEETAKNQLEEANQLNAHLITYFDEEYPRNLYNSNHSVPIIYVLGNLSILKNEKCCAVVGTRKPLDWTKKEIKVAVEKLVSENFTIVSGLALGVDEIAHSTAIENDGKTIAVVGCGVDFPYPRQNYVLRNKIVENGAIISEYPFGTKVLVFGLKKRNKIIVGLSKHVLVTQTSEKGGTMNAYRAALEQKKPVGIFYPPRFLRKQFDGNLKILKDGKIPVLKFASGKDVNFSRDIHVQSVLV